MFFKYSQSVPRRQGFSFYLSFALLRRRCWFSADRLGFTRLDSKVFEWEESFPGTLDISCKIEDSFPLFDSFTGADYWVLATTVETNFVIWVREILCTRNLWRLNFWMNQLPRDCCLVLGMEETSEKTQQDVRTAYYDFLFRCRKCWIRNAWTISVDPGSC